MALRSALINVMVRSVEKAGKALLRDFGEVEHLQVSRKGPGNFVSTADQKSEAILKEELGRARPDFGFWMEESGKLNEGKAERWIIDPLDGTLNFLHGLPLWSVTVAAERDGEIIAGVIYEPMTDYLFWAEKGVGAFVNNQRLRVSARSEMNDALLSVGFPLRGEFHDDADYKLLENVTSKVAGWRRLGATSLNLAYTAAGRFDGCIAKRMNPWDTAAGLLMIKEAGGRILSLAGDERPLYADMLLASNFHLHDALATLCKTNKIAA